MRSLVTPQNTLTFKPHFSRSGNFSIRVKRWAKQGAPLLWFCFCSAFLVFEASHLFAQPPNTHLSIVHDKFHINGTPTYEARIWTTSSGEEYPIEGLLMNARLVQGIFDDLNPDTRGQWAYPDTGEWDPDRNTDEFVQAMDVWREHGLLGFTLNLQGGCPYGYCRAQPWENSAFAPDGSLRPAYMDRLERIISRADELGMIVILGYFYFGQDERLRDEAAVIQAVENATEWILRNGYANVVVEINNECNVRYDHAILRCDRVHELIERARRIERDGHSLYVSTSLGGGSVPPSNIVEASDFILLHGNGVKDPERMVEMIQEVRQTEAYRPVPIVVNEDDQPWRVEEQGWGEKGNNFVEAVRNRASWGYFDFRQREESQNFNAGYQSIPVNWQISSERKRQFFQLLAEITGSPGTPRIALDWSRDVGEVTVQVEGQDEDLSIQRVELLLNSRVAATATRQPFQFRLEEIPQKEHYVQARVLCRRGEREIILESASFKNPWWPYGGPARSSQD